MQEKRFLSIALALVAMGISVAAIESEYLRVAPSFLTPCQFHDNDNSQCFAKAFEHFFTNWKDDISGLKRINSIDPFRARKVRFSQHSEGVDLQVELKNMLAYGMSKARIQKSLNTVNDKGIYSFNLQLHMPAMQIDSDYRLKGRLLVLSLDSRGQLKSEITDVHYTILIKAKLKQQDGETLFDLVSVTTNIKEVGAFRAKFTNLFGGNKDLEDSTHLLFDQNWRDIFEVVRPGIQQTIDAVMFDRYKKIFDFIPTRFFVTDLP